MLRTALRPRSLALLLTCLALATGFVLLSRWQLAASDDASTRFDPAKERVEPLVEAIPAGEPALARFVDQAVELRGHYLPDSTAVIENRIEEGRTGWWVVEAFILDDSAAHWPDAGQDLTVPVVRGWVSSPEEATPPEAGPTVVVGRYLPPEAPVSTQEMPPGHYASLSPAQLGNVWDRPVYSGFVTAQAEAAPGEMNEGEKGALPSDGTLRGADYTIVEVGQQPTERQIDWLNVFYAVEWVVFAGFALYIWGRFVLDEHRREADPQRWYELDAEGAAYYFDEAAGKFYYYDSIDQAYYYFDGQDTAGDSRPG